MALLRSSARPKLLQPTGFDSPARADLAIAIAARDALQADVDRLKAAEEPLEQAQRDAWRAITAAKEAVEAAQISATEYVLAKASGNASAAPMTTRQARDALADAEDADASVKAAQAKRRAELDAAEMSLGFAREKVKKAVAAVMREHPDLPALVGRIDKLQRELLEAAATLALLIDNRAIELSEQYSGNVLHTPFIDLCARYRLGWNAQRLDGLI